MGLVLLLLLMLLSVRRGERLIRVAWKCGRKKTYIFALRSLPILLVLRRAIRFSVHGGYRLEEGKEGEGRRNKSGKEEGLTERGREREREDRATKRLIPKRSERSWKSHTAGPRLALLIVQKESSKVLTFFTKFMSRRRSIVPWSGTAKFFESKYNYGILFDAKTLLLAARFVWESLLPAYIRILSLIQWVELGASSK